MIALARGGFNINVRPQTLGINDLLSEYGVRIDDPSIAAGLRNTG